MVPKVDFSLKRKLKQRIESRKAEFLGSKCITDEQFKEECEVSLIIDSYDEIFSSFDPRAYSQRALSDDFLQESRRATREAKPDKLQLKFLVPHRERNDENEAIIKKRLHDHFKKHADRLTAENKRIFRNGIILSVVGFSLMVVAAYISTFYDENFFLHLVKVIVDPAGWFTVWYGLDQIFYTMKDEEKELYFNKKMSHSDIIFESY